MSDPITLVVWRDAREDPPGHYCMVATDAGLGFYVADGEESMFYYAALEPGPYSGYGLGDIMDPQPRWWTDLDELSPPTNDALTVEDVELAAVACALVANDLEEASEGRSASTVLYREAAARLRAALPTEGGER
jgi:hypothetical protein